MRRLRPGSEAEMVALFLRTTPASLLSSLRQPAAVSALVLSLETTAITLALALGLGTPAAYLLARWQFPGKRLLDSLVDLPIVVPPAVAGVALLMAFGREGLLGPALNGARPTLTSTSCKTDVALRFASYPGLTRANELSVIAKRR